MRSNLEGIGGVLKECAESPGIKKVLMRQDILLKIKRCDNMLTHALSLFQVRLVLQNYPYRSSNHPLCARRRRWPSVFTLRSLLKAVR